MVSSKLYLTTSIEFALRNVNEIFVNTFKIMFVSYRYKKSRQQTYKEIPDVFKETRNNSLYSSTTLTVLAMLQSATDNVKLVLICDMGKDQIQYHLLSFE